ncbi:MAG: FAD binding domain-containing protein [Sporomusa sp.]
MIAFDFDYYRPTSLEQAYDIYIQLKADNKVPVYFAGGTELISMARVNSREFKAVIDLKGVSECNQFGMKKGKLIIGSALTLTQIAVSKAFPLLSDTIIRIADHTIQGKITLGGNLAGTIKYREASLPLMISRCTATIMTENGLVQVPFLDCFNGHLLLKEDEYLVGVGIDEDEIGLPYQHVKRTKMDKIDYPLVTIAATKRDNTALRAAITGYGDKPLLLPAETLSDTSITIPDRIKSIIQKLRQDNITDLSGSKEYKEFVLENMLTQMFKNFKD